jgi:hypothetical protein
MDITSRMRSSPANASLICVLIEAICITGAASRPTKKMKENRSPRVMVPLRIARPPTRISTRPTSPTTTVANDPTAETPVMVLATFLNIRCTPPVNTRCSRCSVPYAFTTRMPPSVSVSRPVTSAVIWLRSRKTGRMRVNMVASTAPKSPSTTRIAMVSCQFSQNRNPRATSAVKLPPTSCTMPVPTRFRMPSASFMMRLTATPTWVESK